MNSDRRRALDAMRRWWWLLLVAPIAMGLGARKVDAWLEGDGRPEYSATALLLVAETGRSTYSASTYSELLLTTSVLEPVVTTLSLPYDVGALKERVHADPIVGPNDQPTELLGVRVVDANPERAADIANAVADSFVSYVADQSRQLAEAAQSELDAQIEETRRQIADARQRLQLLEKGPDSADPSNREQVDALRRELQALQQELADQSQSAQMTDRDPAADLLQVSVADEAIAPHKPDVSERIDPTAPAAAVGFVLAIGAILGVAYFDKTIWTATEVEALTGAPLLGVVPRVARLRPGRAQVFTVAQPRSSAADAIRLIRTSLEFVASERVTTTVVISSPGPDEGRSTITVSLAAAIAQTMRSVMIIDADLRRPSLHKVFGVRNERGLSTLLGRPEQPWWSAAVPTTIPRLNLIPSGPLPPNPSDLLSLDRLPQLLEEINDSVDFVLIDTPPLLPVSDALEVAANADGVILVCRANQTRRGTLEAAVARLVQHRIRLIGTVLNYQRRRESTFGFGYPPTANTDPTADGNDVGLGPSLMCGVDDGVAGPLQLDGGDWDDAIKKLGPGGERSLPLPAFE